MSVRVLVTLGRLPKGLEVARCLRGAGCTVFVADPFGSHLSKPSRAVEKSFKVTAPNDSQEGFLSDLLKLVKRFHIDLIIPVSEEAIHVAGLAGRLPPETHLFCPPPPKLMRLHDKFSFIEAVREAGLLAPKTFRGDDPAAQALSEKEGYVVKPALGCSGNGLRLANKGEPLLPTEQIHQNVVQQRIDGQEVSTFSIARGGKVLGTVVYKGLIFAGTVATNFARLCDQEAIETWIEAFVKAEQYSGVIAFDFMIDKTTGAAYPIECNPRLTSGIHFLQHRDLAKAFLREPLDHAMRFKPESRFQEGHTSLTKAYSALLRPRTFFNRLALVLTTRDVLWSWRDPLPFFLMTPMSWPVLRQVLFKGASFGEAATKDIEWLPPADKKEGSPKAHESAA